MIKLYRVMRTVEYDGRTVDECVLVTRNYNTAYAKAYELSAKHINCWIAEREG